MNIEFELFEVFLSLLFVKKNEIKKMLYFVVYRNFMILNYFKIYLLIKFECYLCCLFLIDLMFFVKE